MSSSELSQNFPDFPYYRMPLGPSILSADISLAEMHKRIRLCIIRMHIHTRFTRTIAEISEIRRLTARPLFTSRGTLCNIPGVRIVGRSRVGYADCVAVAAVARTISRSFICWSNLR